MNLAETIPATLEDGDRQPLLASREATRPISARPRARPAPFTTSAAWRSATWNLWGARPGVSTVLCDHFKTRFGLGCADDMSSMILKGLWAKVRGEAYEADADAAYYHAFWRRQGRDADSPRK
jgi:hypothetical protein